jgi:hypothetical protein
MAALVVRRLPLHFRNPELIIDGYPQAPRLRFEA